jgi:hypothetical protein
MCDFLFDSAIIGEFAVSAGMAARAARYAPEEDKEEVRADEGAIRAKRVGASRRRKKCAPCLASGLYRTVH